MSIFDSLRYRFRVLSRPRDHERDVAEEINHHLRLETMQRAHAAHGDLSPGDAGDAARRRFGNVTYYREERRRVAGLGFFDVLVQDVRFALRSFRRSPTFTIVVVATLAIGIGANTAIFSAVDALLLRALPFEAPDRLMSLSLTIPPRGPNPARNDLNWSYGKFNVFRTAQTAFADATIWFNSDFTLGFGEEVSRRNGDAIDSHYLPVLGIKPALGRGFLPEEDRIGGARVLLISDRLWQQAFNADPAVLGRSISVDGTPYTVVGVTPPGFGGLAGSVDFWLPLISLPAVWGPEWLADPGNHSFKAVARLAPGVTPVRATAAVEQLGPRIDAAFPDPRSPVAHWGATARELDGLRVDSRIRATLFVLCCAVGIVLLIACANVANLFLVRASGRRREIAVRLAIGAGRGRLVRQLLVEALLLSLIGGVLGIGVAWAGVTFLSSVQPASVLRLENVGGLGAVDFATIELNLRALGFAGALAIATGLLFGLVPALQTTRPSLTEALKTETASRVTSLRGVTSRNVLTVVEITLAVVLLAGSGLMIRSLGHLIGVRPGFDADHVLTMRINRAPAWSRDSIVRFYDVALARLATVPGVVDVGLGDCPPLNPGCSGGTVMAFHDRSPAAPGAEARVGMHWITPGWISVLHVPVIRGRALNSGDRLGAPRAILINQTAARKFWPGQNPIGRPVAVGQLGPRTDTAYVVGVIGDVYYGTMDSTPEPDIYVSYYQAPISYRMMLFIRTRGDPAAIAGPARTALREVAPGFPVYDVVTMDRRVANSLAYANFGAVVLGLFAAVALALATMGTYGVISFAVAQRTREMGVRLALGATAGDIMRLVVGQGVTLAVVGVVFGVAAALAVTRVMRSMLFDVQPSDPLTLVGIVVVLLLAVVAASLIPARRAAGVPAMRALRGD